MDLETRRRGLVLGVRLRLLQMVWTSWQTSAVPASTTALLELAATVLSKLSATGRSAAAATGALSTTAADLSSNPATSAGASGLLVLH
jgi:hypothetical protein